MTIQAITNHGVANFGFANPVQNLGKMAIAMLAMNIISNLPGAEAAPSAERQACEIACTPLPGGKDDIPERICVETCANGAEIIKTTVKQKMKNGAWKVIGVLGKVATPITGYIDCGYVCSPEGAAQRAGGTAMLAAGKWLFGNTEGAVKDLAGAGYGAACSALLVGNLVTPGAGTAACMACCAPMKYYGKV